MVIIGGMRSLLGPALGALFYILFREYLSIWTPNWLLYFGLLFVAFIVFSPTGLVGVWRRLTEPLRARGRRGRGDGGALDRAGRAAARVPAAGSAAADGIALEAQGLAKAFGGIQAVDGREPSSCADRSLHALIGPNGAGKTTVFNLISGMFAPDRGTVVLAGRTIAGLPPHRDRRRGARPLVPDHQPVPRVSIEENLRLAVQARDARASTAGRRAAQRARSSARRGARALPRA